MTDNRRFLHVYRAVLLTCFLWVSISPFSLGQDVNLAGARYTFNLEGMALSEAFDSVVEGTSINVALDVALLEGKISVCHAIEVTLEELLACVVNGTGLEIRQLPSGTYTVVESPDAVLIQGELTGRVIDAESGEPLVSAHVLLAQVNTGDITNTSGRFSFSRLDPGLYQVSVTYIGYQDFIETVEIASGGE